MPDNVFQPTLSETSAYTAIQSPVRDEATAQAVDLVTKVGVAGARASAVNDLLGDARTIDEAAASSLNAAEEGADVATVSDVEQKMALETIDNLSKLSRARKAGLGLDQARDRARAVLARAVNDNPLFADDIRKAYKSYFGGVGKDLFDATPEEKAAAQYREDRAELSLVLGVSESEAGNRLRKRALNEERLTEIQATKGERDLTGDEYLQGVELNSQNMMQDIQSDIFAEIQANGALSPELKQAFTARIRAAKLDAQRAANNLLRDPQGRLVYGSIDRESLNAGNQRISQMETDLLNLVNDTELLKVVQDNNAITNARYQTAVMKNYGGWKALKDAVGPEVTSLIFQATLDNEAYAQVIRNSATGKAIIRGGEAFYEDFPTAVSLGAGSLFGVKEQMPQVERSGAAQNELAQEGVLAIMANPKGTELINKAVEQNAGVATATMKDALSKKPEAAVVFASPRWRARISQDPAKWNPVVDEALKGAANGVRGQIVAAGGSATPQLTIERVTLRGQPTDRITVRGASATGAVEQRVEEAFKVAINNPGVWQGRFNSPEDYVRSLFGIEVETTEE